MSADKLLRVTEATEKDVPLILRFIRDHAEFEKALDRLSITKDRLNALLFGPQPGAEVLIAYLGEEPAGFAMYYFSCSSYTGLPNLYLEDIFVTPAYRGSGVGKKLLASLALRANERGCGRMEWCVLSWNESAVGFYERLGAAPVRDWTVFHMGKNAMDELAKFAEG
ncbi:MAG TPA: GNAT family N-acetyltransferase [Pyrinomonadaceae bacterium]|jgi:GNAT superfamily N-acetyltransferase|nr:GNAT family N-acetyltransferase [Pyrinomonadaceae bacterium]